MITATQSQIAMDIFFLFSLHLLFFSLSAFFSLMGGSDGRDHFITASCEEVQVRSLGKENRQRCCQQGVSATEIKTADTALSELPLTSTCGCISWGWWEGEVVEGESLQSFSPESGGSHSSSFLAQIITAFPMKAHSLRVSSSVN